MLISYKQTTPSSDARSRMLLDRSCEPSKNRHEPVLDIPWPDLAAPGENGAERNVATEEPE